MSRLRGFMVVSLCVVIRGLPHPVQILRGEACIHAGTLPRWRANKPLENLCRVFPARPVPTSRLHVGLARHMTHIDGMGQAESLDLASPAGAWRRPLAHTSSN